jgi:hypothetical protein
MIVATAPATRSAAAERMRLHRERRRHGLQCLMIELHVTEIEALVGGNGNLTGHMFQMGHSRPMPPVRPTASCLLRSESEAPADCSARTQRRNSLVTDIARKR